MTGLNGIGLSRQLDCARGGLTSLPFPACFPTEVNRIGFVNLVACQPMSARADIHSEGELEDRLSEPTPAVIETLGALAGDIIVLGIGGKMGPTLARMARR